MTQNKKQQKSKKVHKKKKAAALSKFRKSQPVSTVSSKKLQSQKQVSVHRSNSDITKVINKNIQLQMIERARNHKEILKIFA